jgi:hydrophobe/amphiphile efflux-3 (HAE3) family protein
VNVAAIARRVAGACARRPLPVIVAVLAIATAGAVAAAVRLHTDTGTDTLVDRGSATAVATRDFNRQFGDEAIRVLVQADLNKLMLTSDLGRLVSLEGCLAGNARGSSRLPAVCDRLADLRPAQVVFGPGTFVNEAANEILSQFQAQQALTKRRAAAAARDARRQAAKQGLPPAIQAARADQAKGQVESAFTQTVLTAALRYGITSQPAINNPNFVSQVVFDPRKPQGAPKSRFAYLFPSKTAALITIRPRPDLTESQRSTAIRLIKAAVADKTFRLSHSKGTYVVSGPPVVVEALTSSLERAIFVLLGAALVLMALALALVFRPPLRLLPLAVALGTAGTLFGAMALLGVSLTMASIAVLPVLIGLAVDYAIQFQARFNEATAEGLDPAEAAAEAAGRGAPVIATAGLATAAGLLVLLLSPVPMVRGFGLLLVCGIALGFCFALTAGFAALSYRRRGPGRGQPQWMARVDELRELLTARARGAGRSALAICVGRPERVLAVACVLAVTGWAAGTQTKVVSDIRELVPGNLGAIKDVNKLQDATGVSGEIDVTVSTADLTSPAVVSWMRDFQERVLARGGYSGDSPSCARARLCPAFSLPDLFRNRAGKITRNRITSLLDAIPPYFSQAVITRDRRTATLAFGIRVMPLDQQRQLIGAIRSEIDPPGTAEDPPRGVKVALAGLPVLAAEANGALSDSRYWITLAGLAAVMLALLAVHRSVRRALVPLVPVVLATGWSALVIAAMDIPLNPMSATLGALVIAIATEFSVLLSARYEEERRAGRSPGEALRRGYAGTGTAVLASGATAIAGFAALIATDIRMLRDFGLVTVVDLAVALAGVMLVLPAVLVYVEERRLRAGTAPASVGVAAPRSLALFRRLRRT